MANPSFKFTVDQELVDAIKAHTEALNRFCEAAAAQQPCPAAEPALQHPAPFPEAAPVLPHVNPVNPSIPLPVVSTAPAAAVTPAATPAVPTAGTVPAQPTPSQEDIMRAGGELMSRGVNVMPLLQKYGIQMVTQLPVEQYPAFVADLRAMGANI